MTGQAAPPSGPQGYRPPPPRYPPAGPYPPPGLVPVRRRHSRWLTIGLPVIGVLFLGAAGTAITLFINAVGRDIRPAQQAADAYGRALVNQRFADAQHMMCARDRAAISPAALAEHYFQPALRGYRVEGVNVTNYSGQVAARATLRFTTADGLRTSATLPLVKENGTWRPCP